MRSIILVFIVLAAIIGCKNGAPNREKLLEDSLNNLRAAINRNAANIEGTAEWKAKQQAIKDSIYGVQVREKEKMLFPINIEIKEKHRSFMLGGGIMYPVITVTNNNKYACDDLELNVKYIRANGTKSANYDLPIGILRPNETKVIDDEKNQRSTATGKKILITISKLKCSSLGLNYVVNPLGERLNINN